jgi:enolase-phosphatase E1
VSRTIRAILLDIEGTTTPISFVYEVLFPYARRHLRRYVEQHAASADHAALYDRLRDEHAADRAGGEAVPPWVDEPPAARTGSILSYLDWLMDRDRKSTALKSLQGLIWEEGYRGGDLVGEVFADVPPALARWRAQEIDAGIFSSGSMLAQQLLFRHSSAGDLTSLLRWYFDTTTGPKTDPGSYRRIAAAMDIPSASVLFVSDIVAELDAARPAGMQTRLCIRPGNQPPPLGHGHREIRTFDEVTTSA